MIPLRKGEEIQTALLFRVQTTGVGKSNRALSRRLNEQWRQDTASCLRRSMASAMAGLASSSKQEEQSVSGEDQSNLAEN
jgi:hypothetical protein